MGEQDEPLIVINADILTNVDVRALYEFHTEYNADITVCVREYSIEIPYGVMETDAVHVTALREKPTYKFFVNAGIYLIEPHVINYIQADQRLDMTELMERVIKSDGRVISFPITEYWIDIGQHMDYERAQDDIREGRFERSSSAD